MSVTLIYTDRFSPSGLCKPKVHVLFFDRSYFSSLILDAASLVKTEVILTRHCYQAKRVGES